MESREERMNRTFCSQAGLITDFIDTYEMTLVSGRDFDRSFTSDKDACMINESAVRNFGITDMIKTRFMVPGFREITSTCRLSE